MSANDYQAKLATPAFVLGIRTTGECLSAIDYLPPDVSSLPPQNPFAVEVCRQLQEYLTDPHYLFDLPLQINGTPYQQRVWQSIRAIPSGATSSYARIALQLHSSPRAVGRACGANQIPIVIPCHRVIAKNGHIGGFMNAREGLPLTIKRWLLHHEGV